ncbi:S8 family serine peptidase [Kribbella sp. NPDC056951]|uniref:S8 family serine peptidase n=1 Tax=Kribbella sp. NPDC056951 TaxID=3345978 RepID=UPI0036264964
MILGWRRRRSVLATGLAALLIGVSGCSGGDSAPESGAPNPPPSTVRPAEVTQRNPGWALDRIDQHQRPLNQRFSTTGEGQGVTVYVVDGLFDVLHSDFGGRASVGLKAGVACSLEDGTNHGLFVAGLVAGRRTGVAKQAKVVSVGSSYGCEGLEGEVTEAQRVARLAEALNWVADHATKPAVVNLSFNVSPPVPAITAAVQRIVDAGLTVVASAGNDGEDACKHPPAGLPKVVTVAASTETDEDAGLNHGRCVDLFAPAENVTSLVDKTLVPSGIAASEGAATSWAAPIVSGAAALYLSVHRTATPEEVRTWLIKNATQGALKGPLQGSPNRLLFTGGPR